jgi:hypothetical protein
VCKGFRLLRTPPEKLQEFKRVRTTLNKSVHILQSRLFWVCISNILSNLSNPFNSICMFIECVSSISSTTICQLSGHSGACTSANLESLQMLLPERALHTPWAPVLRLFRCAVSKLATRATRRMLTRTFICASVIVTGTQTGRRVAHPKMVREQQPRSSGIQNPQLLSGNSCIQ